MRLSFERLGWLKCRWSGFSFQNDGTFERVANGHYYSSCYFVCGWWVYQFRIWVILNLPNVRQWWHYPIQMPVNAEGQGPVSISEATDILYEVWDRSLQSHDSFDNLPDAINDAMRRNFHVL